MIKLGDRPQVPSRLQSEDVGNLKESIAEKVKSGHKIRSDDFESKFWRGDVKEELWRHHRSKCCYCEQRRALKRESDVEHYRPKSSVYEDPDHSGYWWLAYEWTNYLYACKYCNQEHKKNHFPLLDDMARAQGPDDDLEKERPFLINPIDEDPIDYICFDWQSSDGLLVKAIGLDEDGRGTNTIKLTGLNRPDLMKERADVILTLRTLVRTMMYGEHLGLELIINRTAEEIRKETAADKPFAGFRRAYFRSAGLYEYVSDA